MRGRKREFPARELRDATQRGNPATEGLQPGIPWVTRIPVLLSAKSARSVVNTRGKSLLGACEQFRRLHGGTAHTFHAVNEQRRPGLVRG